MLTIGNIIEISIKRNGKNYVFPSKVEDVRTEGLLIGMPLKGNQTYNVDIGEMIEINFLYRESLYCIEGLVIRKSYTPIPVLLVKPNGSPYKIQRRGYFRLKVSINAKIKDEESEDYTECLVKDISASGALIAVRKSFEINKTINIRFTLGSDLIELNAVVKRVEHYPTRHVYPHDVAIQFKDINEPQRDIIIKFILEQQRILRKKGLI